MTRLVQVAVAGDVSEAEELQEMLASAGIDASLETAVDDEAGVPDQEHVKVLVAESSVDAARDAIEAMTEPEDEYGYE
jgi:hypothetical protein